MQAISWIWYMKTNNLTNDISSLDIYARYICMIKVSSENKRNHADGSTDVEMCFTFRFIIP